MSANVRREVRLARLLRPACRATIDVHGASRSPDVGITVPRIAPSANRIPIPPLGILGRSPRGAVTGPVMVLMPGAERVSFDLIAARTSDHSS